jgi:hypothetical protein
MALSVSPEVSFDNAQECKGIWEEEQGSFYYQNLSL